MNNKKYDKIQKFQSKRGFTLIELMVSTSIFMIVMLVAIGSLLVTSNAAKKSYSLNFTMDNLGFAVESMSRSLRMGTNYTCSSSSIILGSNLLPKDCPNGGTMIAFIPAEASSNDRTAYKLESNTNGTKTIQRCKTSANGISCEDMVSPTIHIDMLKFFVRGSSPTDLIQPSVYMLLRGSVTIKEKITSFAIQTLISQRTAE